MGYNKFILSGNQLELYEYEKESFARGRPRGYKVNFNREDLGVGGIATFQQRAFFRRRDNARRTSLAFKRRVLANLSAGENPLLFTLTHKANQSSHVESARIFKVFVQRMRREYGSEFRYLAVPEFQKRGAIHYHALFWGLPNSVYYNERRTRKIAKIWGSGFIDILETDGHDKLASYLAKYLLKTITDPRLFYYKAFFASRNCKKPLISSGFPRWWFDEEFSTFAVCKVKDYMTHWLGKGRYTLLNNK